MPALGGDARLVAPRGRAPRFSPDGSRVAYWTGEWIAGPRAPGSAVFVVPAIGGPPTRLADGFATANMPLWSPDGRSLLFFGRKSADTSPSEAFDWWWISLDGGEPVATGTYPLLADKGLDVVDIASESSGAAWTAKGLILAARRGESINLWRVGISERDGRVRETSLERLTTGAGSDLLPSADASNRIVFQAAIESAVSLTLPLESNTATVQGTIARQSYDAGDRENRNSLDQSGRRLAHVKKRQRESEIWLKDLMTGREQHVLTIPSFGINLSVSPNGTKIAYAQSDNGVNVVYSVPATGGTPTKVCERCNLEGWFPDSGRIVTSDSAPDGGGRVAVIDATDGARSDLIVYPRTGIRRVDVSTDGRWLSFNNATGIWLAPVRPGSPPPESEWVTLLTKPEGTGERSCGWSPDGRLLYLLLERDGFRDLYAQRIDPARGVPVGQPFVVQHLHNPRRRWGSTPVGTAIVNNAFVFNQVEMTGSIWLLDMSDGIGAGRGPRP
jgi:eukaryotic-like serine/threonine-protein kinase